MTVALTVRARKPSIALWRLVVAFIVLAAWELYARFIDADWFSQPTEIARRLGELAFDRLPTDIAITLTEIGLGFVFGLPAGVVVGLWLGRSPVVAALLRPIIITLNSVPVVALAPLLIMWFGLGLAPKVALVAMVVFFLVFFNTFAGAQAVDRDLVETLQVMGATRRENFQKVIAPASVAWILGGVRAALPYSLIAATVGEMMLSRGGVGNCILTASAQFDSRSIIPGRRNGGADAFARWRRELHHDSRRSVRSHRRLHRASRAMILGAILSDCAQRLERSLLRWRTVDQG